MFFFAQRTVLDYFAFQSTNQLIYFIHYINLIAFFNNPVSFEHSPKYNEQSTHFIEDHSMHGKQNVACK